MHGAEIRVKLPQPKTLLFHHFNNDSVEEIDRDTELDT
jgi:hypothetical protein